MSAGEVYIPRALGGSPLVGDKLVRLVYLDESGTSAREDIATVAGVVVNFDRDLGALEAELDRVRVERVPVEHRQDFVFHATELFFGAKKGKAFARIETTAEERWPVLKELAAIPSRMSIPIVVGYTRKDRNLGSDENIWHSLAYIFAAVAADQYMKNHAPPDEFALLVAENKPEVRATIKKMHKLIQSGYAANVFPGLANQLPISRIKETVLFADKEDSVSLQAADAQAFIWRRYFEFKPESDDFLDALLDGRGRPPPDTVRRQKEGFGSTNWKGSGTRLIPFQ